MCLLITKKGVSLRKGFNFPHMQHLADLKSIFVEWVVDCAILRASRAFRALRALRAYVSYVLTCLTCLRAFTSYVPSFFYVPYAPSFFYVPYASSLFYVPYVPLFFTCLAYHHFLRGFILLRAFIFLCALHAFNFLRFFMFCVPYVPSFFTCLRFIYVYANKTHTN